MPQWNHRTRRLGAIVQPLQRRPFLQSGTSSNKEGRRFPITADFGDTTTKVYTLTDETDKLNMRIFPIDFGQFHSISMHLQLKAEVP